MEVGRRRGLRLDRSRTADGREPLGRARRTAPPACWATRSNSPSERETSAARATARSDGRALHRRADRGRARGRAGAPRAAGRRPVAGGTARSPAGARRPARAGVPQRRVGTEPDRRSARPRPRRPRADRIFDAVAGVDLTGSPPMLTDHEGYTTASGTTGDGHRPVSGQRSDVALVAAGRRPQRAARPRRSAGPTRSRSSAAGRRSCRSRRRAALRAALVQVALWVGGHRPVASTRRPSAKAAIMKPHRWPVFVVIVLALGGLAFADHNQTEPSRTPTWSPTKALMPIGIAAARGVVVVLLRRRYGVAERCLRQHDRHRQSESERDHDDAHRVSRPPRPATPPVRRPWRR